MISPFGLRHILLMRELQGDCVALDRKIVLLEGSSNPFWAALRGYALRPRSDVHTFVLRAPRGAASLSGFVQAKGEHCVQGWPSQRSHGVWRLVTLAPMLDHRENAATIWYRLLLHLCAVAGEYQVQRLHARLPVDSPAEDVFRQAGFAIYCREAVFRREDATAPGRESPDVRPLQPLDHWDLQTLWIRLTPRMVAQAESGNGSRDDSTSDSPPLSQSGRVYSLYGRKGHMRGCISVLAKPQGVWLRLLVSPGDGEAAGELLDHALLGLAQHPQRPAYFAVRDYQGGLSGLLGERGFRQDEDHALLVKHTTVKVRSRRRQLVPALEKRAEVAPTVSGSTLHDA